ncbi:protein of unknown function [Shinella sp. WSC3-e]|nr:protein of unknown function [Shinella sp. WSC3-e]
MHDEPAPQFRERKVDGRAGGLVGSGDDRAALRAIDPDCVGARCGDLAGDRQDFVRPAQTVSEHLGRDSDGDGFNAVVDSGLAADRAEVEARRAAKPLTNGGL